MTRPTSRHMAENGDGTVTDQFSDLVWLKDANCFGLTQWLTATDAPAGLRSGQCGLTDGSSSGDWRLPSREEWQGILSPGCENPPKIDGFFICFSLSGEQWAFDVQDGYWSSTDSGGTAWFASTLTGGLTLVDKTSEAFVWPVRDGQ